MTNLTNVFNNETVAVTGGKNQLALTALLTSTSTEIANDIVNKLDTIENGGELVLEMYDNVATMQEQIVQQLADMTVDNSWLQDISKEEAIKMLKSQQSKRSRAKSATRTLTNFKTMLTAAVAEELLRRAHDITRTAGSGTTRRTELVLTDEMIAVYTADQGLLNKAIRNVQSKKSIMKKKTDFNELSEDYQQLLAYEMSLKSLRTNNSAVDTQTIEKAKKAEEVEQLLSSIDPSKMKKDDLAEALERMKEMMMSSIK